MTHFALWPPAPFRTCGGCGLLYHVQELRSGRGRHLGEHPEHRYAPCGHSQDWHGWEPAEVEPDPPFGLEFFDPEPDLDGLAVASDADPFL